MSARIHVAEHAESDALFTQPPSSSPTATKVFHMKKSKPSRQIAQQYVGGPVQVRTLADGSQILSNELGLMRRLPLNKIASQLANARIYGNVLILHDEARWESPE